MTVTVKFGFEENHTEEQRESMNRMLNVTLGNKKFLGYTVDSDERVIHSFVNQATADEYVEFMAQFDPSTVEVKTV